MGDFWDDRSATRRMLGAMLVAVYLIALALAGLALVTRPASADTLTAATGYKLSYDVYKPDSDVKPLPIAVVFMHGKNSTSDTPGMRSFARSLANEGITVYEPAMPWSKKWDGTADDATAALDALVALVAQTGSKVIVGGQSMGAAFALAWHPADPPPGVVGKLFTSPGHMLDTFPPTSPFWNSITPSLNKAKALIAEGKGASMTRFEGSNTTGEKLVMESYEMRAEVYASLHDPETFPSVRKGLAGNVLPVYWGVGTRDPAGGGKKVSFDRMPPNEKSVYSEIPGDHNSIMRDAIPDIVKWIKGL